MKLNAFQHLLVTVRASFQQKMSHGAVVMLIISFAVLIDCRRDSRSFLTLFCKWSICL